MRIAGRVLPAIVGLITMALALTASPWAARAVYPPDPGSFTVSSESSVDGGILVVVTGLKPGSTYVCQWCLQHQVGAARLGMAARAETRTCQTETFIVDPNGVVRMTLPINSTGTYVITGVGTSDSGEPATKVVTTTVVHEVPPPNPNPGPVPEYLTVGISKVSSKTVRVRVQAVPSCKSQFTFKVQKSYTVKSWRGSDEPIVTTKWKTLPKTYKTKGTAHTAKVTQPKGTYRAKVAGQCGMKGQTSAVWRVKKNGAVAISHTQPKPARSPMRVVPA